MFVSQSALFYFYTCPKRDGNKTSQRKIKYSNALLSLFSFFYAKNRWQRDGEEVTHYPIRWTAPTGQHSAHLETSTLGLTIRQLQPNHFINGALSIVCRAELGSTRRRSTGVKAFLMDPPAPIFDKRRSAQQQLTGLYFFFFKLESTI